MSNVTISIVFVGILVFAAHLFASLFSKRKIPDVLFLIIIGIVIGPLSGLVSPVYFGKLGSVFSNITLVIILFEGGTGLRADLIRSSLRGSMALTIINFIVTTIVIGMAALWVFDFDPLLSFLLGALLGGTASAIVIPMVKSLRLKSTSATILVLESALSDVLCIVVGLSFIEALKMGEVKISSMLIQIAGGFIVSSLVGLAGGFFWSFLLGKVRTLQNSIFTTPAFVFIVYGVAEIIGFNGALAALMFGVGLANIDLIPPSFIKKYTRFTPHPLVENEKLFFSEVIFLLKSFFFVYIGINMILEDSFSLIVGAGITLLVFIIRIPVTNLSIRKSVPIEDRVVIAMMVPKGLAAAVIASIPYQLGLPGGLLIQNISYSVVFFSIVLTSVLILFNDKFAPLNKTYKYFLKH